MKQSQPSTVRFSVLLENYILTTVQKKYSFQVPSDAMLHNMRDTVIECVSSIFKKSKQYNISEKSTKWLANQFFKEIKFATLEGEFVIGDHIVFNDYDPSDLPIEDVILMSRLFNNTKFGEILHKRIYSKEKEELN